MRAILRLLLTGALLSPLAASAQINSANVPANTVIGRLGAGQSGPVEAIPFANFFAQVPLTSLPSGLTLTSPVFAGTASGGTIPNSVLANSSTTVNGVTCTLGSSCSITAVAGGITVGTTTIASGTNGKVEFNNSGVLGEYSITGTGSVAMSASPTFTGTATFSHITAEGTTSTGATGSGSLVFATSPTFTTPTLGAASATTINKLTLTQPATGSTLTIADGKTLTASKTLTLTGTDSTTMTFPGTSDTIPGVGQNNVFTGANTFSRLTVAVRVETANYTINASGNDYLICVRATGSMTITLPGSPSAGDTYMVKDCGGNSSTNNITVSRNGNPIDGAASDILISTNGQSIAFTYIDGTTGWAQN